jgi:hypothetical protein
LHGWLAGQTNLRSDPFSGFLKTHLSGLTGSLYLEFDIPRMGWRIDVAVLSGPMVFVVEFKVGEREFKRAALDQVCDCALDLKNCWMRPSAPGP